MWEAPFYKLGVRWGLDVTEGEEGRNLLVQALFSHLASWSPGGGQFCSSTLFQ